MEKTFSAHFLGLEKAEVLWTTSTKKLARKLVLVDDVIDLVQHDLMVVDYNPQLPSRMPDI